MSKPVEITEAVLKYRISMGLVACFEGIYAPGMVDKFYESGKFSEFVGVVSKMEAFERNRAAMTARRLGHPSTARVIAEGK